MAHFLIQAAYTPEAVTALAKSPQDRVEVVRTVVERLGGRLEAGGIALGDRDLEFVAICNFPDQKTAAAFVIAVSAAGSLRSTRATPLITGSEAVDALHKAADAGYRPPVL
jgi:uncharacterized protein with GYD domain